MVKLPAPNPYTDRREYAHPIRIENGHASKEDCYKEDLIQIRFNSAEVRFRDKRKEEEEKERKRKEEEERKQKEEAERVQRELEEQQRAEEERARLEEEEQAKKCRGCRSKRPKQTEEGEAQTMEEGYQLLCKLSL